MELLNPTEQDASNNARKRKDSQKENVVSEVFNDYCSSTSIHGMGYLGAQDKTLAEKIWWIIVIIISVCCCSYLISKTWTKWVTSPVILSFEQEQTPVWKIPFPAVTVCPLNKVNQIEYNYTEMFLKRNELEGKEYKKFWDISQACMINDRIEETISMNFTDNEIYKNIRTVGPAFEDIFADIKYQGKIKKHAVHDIFSEQITQEGVCFTFNSFSQYDMYTNEVNHETVYINHTGKHSGWNLEEGYPRDSTFLKNYPRRTARDGQGSGLTINLFHLMINTDYVCGQMIEGFKVILHNPAETPRPTQQYYLIPLKRKISFTVKPEMTTTSENLRSMTTSERKCYFSNEKSLRFFKVYTQNNCRTECAVNVTQHRCGCVPFYMPRDKKTPICGFGRINCVEETEVKILEFEMKKKGVNATISEMEAYKIFDRCDCLPSCSDLQFSAETSQTKFHAVETMLTAKLLDLHDDNDDNDDNEYTREFARQIENGILVVTQIDIFFKESQFLALHRSELYGRTDFLANCGGLLGLFMGFSILSLIEIFYFMTIRLWFKWRNRDKRRL